MHQNGKTRKQFAKSLGLIKKKQQLNKTSDEYMEMLSKAIKAGINIHNAFEENTYNAVQKQLAEKENETITHLIEDVLDNKGNLIKKGMLIDDAKKLVASNRKIEETRLTNLAKRRTKQKERK